MTFTFHVLNVFIYYKNIFLGENNWNTLTFIYKFSKYSIGVTIVTTRASSAGSWRNSVLIRIPSRLVKTALSLWQQPENTRSLLLITIWQKDSKLIENAHGELSCYLSTWWEMLTFCGPVQWNIFNFFSLGEGLKMFEYQ